MTTALPSYTTSGDTTVSYGQVPFTRQAELIRKLSERKETAA
jgi:hypothetical protein